MKRIIEHFVDGFRTATKKREGNGRRIGSELKFPLVDTSGEAASREAVDALWSFLESRGWDPLVDKTTDRVVGATCEGPQNETLASCETGYCKTEFAMAHVADVLELRDAVADLRDLLRDFSEQEGVYFLGYGIHPKTPPSRRLLMKKGRTAFWGEVFKSNRVIHPDDGDDIHLFTVNASSQVHVDVGEEEAIDAVNVFNGFTGAQVALTADSSVWQGRVDPEFKCVCEMFWDWWMPDGNRVGIPKEPFGDMEDYIHTIARLQPIYVKRDGEPVGVMDYDTFLEYYQAGQRATGRKVDGQPVELEPRSGDIDQHGTFYWYNARISRYYTLENRVNDQQPPDEMLCVPALTAGLLEVVPQAQEVLKEYDWRDLAAARTAACRSGLDASTNGLAIADLAGDLLRLAQQGLEQRGRGEEQFLAPLWQRLEDRRCPADDAADTFRDGGADALVSARRL